MNLVYLGIIVTSVLTITLIILFKKKVALEKGLQQLKRKYDDLENNFNTTNQRYQRYEELNSTELYLEELKGKIAQTQGKIASLEEEVNGVRQQAEAERNLVKKEIQNLEQVKAKLQKDISLLEEKSYLESFGFYESKYDFEELRQYETALSTIKDEQKKLILANVAATCSQEWTVEGSRAAGKKMENEKLQLMLRAFNGECDAAILKVKYNNVATMENRIRVSFKKINKLGQSVSCAISEQYLDKKLKELFLVFEYQEKKQEEKEEQRRIKEQMREEERARKEIEAELRKTEDEEAKYNLALESARQEMSEASEKQKIKLEAKIQQLEQALSEAELRRERAISRAQMTKSGHVYVISNVGSFGEDVYKIGMTRRLEPEDRVNELGDASVPFPFDIHAMIYCENAPELENLLHKRFHLSRVNQINERKEFFKVSIASIAKAVEEISSQNHTVNAAQLHFTLLAEAAEYRKSLAKVRANSTGIDDQTRQVTQVTMIASSLDTVQV